MMTVMNGLRGSARRARGTVYPPGPPYYVVIVVVHTNAIIRLHTKRIARVFVAFWKTFKKKKRASGIATCIGDECVPSFPLASPDRHGDTRLVSRKLYVRVYLRTRVLCTGHVKSTELPTSSFVATAPRATRKRRALCSRAERGWHDGWRWAATWPANRTRNRRDRPSFENSEFWTCSSFYCFFVFWKTLSGHESAPVFARTSGVVGRAVEKTTGIEVNKQRIWFRQ